MSRIIPFIMSGGAGSRLWPLSRGAYPKQLLALVTDQTMVQETAQRLSGEAYAAPVFICNAAHSGPISAQMADMGREIGAIITEPMGRNTAPVAIIAALHALESGSLVLLAPADHHVTKPEAFREAVAKAVPAAKAGKLVTFGITPDGPETGYGYIERSAPLGEGVYDVKAFREKPDFETAQQYVDSGDFVWNAGIFLFAPKAFLTEIARFEPEMVSAATAAYKAAHKTGVQIDLPDAEFGACPAQSIDYAVMEKTNKAAVVPCQIGWNDIGSFAALYEARKDGAGMAAPKGTIAIKSTNCLVHSDGPQVALVGVEGLSVIVKDGAVLVSKLSESQSVKTVVETLKSEGRKELL